MANINPRTVFAYVVPAFVAIISFYWFKKKGFKRRPNEIQKAGSSEQIVNKEGSVTSRTVCDTQAEPTEQISGDSTVPTQDKGEVITQSAEAISRNTSETESRDLSVNKQATQLITADSAGESSMVVISDETYSSPVPLAEAGGDGRTNTDFPKELQDISIEAAFQLEIVEQAVKSSSSKSLRSLITHKSEIASGTASIHSPRSLSTDQPVNCELEMAATVAAAEESCTAASQNTSVQNCDSHSQNSVTDKEAQDTNLVSVVNQDDQVKSENCFETCINQQSEYATQPEDAENAQVRETEAVESLQAAVSKIHVNNDINSSEADVQVSTSAEADSNKTETNTAEKKASTSSSIKDSTAQDPHQQKEYTELHLQRINTTVADTNTSAYGSANHSPSEDMLESPAASNFSDIHSEGSSDSGKGGSDIHMPNNEVNTVSTSHNVQTYEFELPQELCGRLIGRHGQTVTYLKIRSHANIYVKRHPFNEHLKLCVVMGSQPEIENALHLIRRKFPLSKFPGVTLTQVNAPLTNGIPVPETLQLHLPEGIMCDVILSSLVNGGHFFVQQPTHPTYPSLNRLDQCMLTCYMQVGTPELPRPVESGVICAAPMLGGWYRAQVAYVYEESDDCEVKFVDYGGYARVTMSTLRQIRSDFMTLPFQASECYLANVAPVDEEAGWTLEAYATFEELAQGQILQAQVVAYAEDNAPYVHLYRIQGATTTFINRELVTRGVALWVEHEV